MAILPEALKDVKALTFDVFGTVVDWRSTVHGELSKRARNKIASASFSTLPEPLQSHFGGISDADWGRFGQEWRESYGKFTQTFVPGETEWKDIDTHHYHSLKILLQDWDVAGVYTDEEVKSLSLIWHYLKPWDDSALGIQRLGTRYVTATLSNGNRSLLEDLNAHGSLGFRRIISTADFGAYKVRKALGVEVGGFCATPIHHGACIRAVGTYDGAAIFCDSDAVTHTHACPHAHG